MKRSAFILSALIFAGAGSVAHAQSTPKTPTVEHRDSVSVCLRGRPSAQVYALEPMQRICVGDEPDSICGLPRSAGSCVAGIRRLAQIVRTYGTGPWMYLLDGTQFFKRCSALKVSAELQ